MKAEDGLADDYDTPPVYVLLLWSACSFVPWTFPLYVVDNKRLQEPIIKLEKKWGEGTTKRGKKKDEKKWPTLSKQRRREVEGGG